MMKALIRDKYGSSEVLEIAEVERPEPQTGEVLVRVHAVSLNSSDNEFLSGKPAFIRMWGLFSPPSRTLILGSDIAGVVEACGAAVGTLQIGDEVFGDIMYRWGGLAEYVCIPESELSKKSGALTFDQVAAVPQAALVALQGLRDRGIVRRGQRVLINGAGGGAGSFAVQLAKMYGAQVTGVDRGNKLELMRSLGADLVIDYLSEDFEKRSERYDLVLDLMAHRSLFDWKKVLKKEGRYVMAGGSTRRLLSMFIFGPLLSLLGRKKFLFLMVEQNRKEDLLFVQRLIESGEIKCAIGKMYPLSEAPRAFKDMSEGRALGKLVIHVTS